MKHLRNFARTHSTAAGHRDSFSFSIPTIIPLNIESFLLSSGVIGEGRDCDLAAELAISTEKVQGIGAGGGRGILGNRSNYAECSYY